MIHNILIPNEHFYIHNYCTNYVVEVTPLANAALNAVCAAACEEVLIAEAVLAAVELADLCID